MCRLIMTDLRTLSGESAPATYSPWARHTELASRARLVLGGAIGLTLFGLLYGVQLRYLQSQFGGQVEWATTLRVSLVHWYLWGVLAFPIVLISRYVRFGALRPLQFLAIHVAAAVALVLAQVALRTTWDWLFEQVGVWMLRRQTSPASHSGQLLMRQSLFLTHRWEYVLLHTKQSASVSQEIPKLHEAGSSSNESVQMD